MINAMIRKKQALGFGHLSMKKSNQRSSSENRMLTREVDKLRKR